MKLAFIAVFCIYYNIFPGQPQEVGRVKIIILTLQLGS